MLVKKNGYPYQTDLRRRRRHVRKSAVFFRPGSSTKSCRHHYFRRRPCVTSSRNEQRRGPTSQSRCGGTGRTVEMEPYVGEAHTRVRCAGRRVTSRAGPKAKGRERRGADPANVGGAGQGVPSKSGTRRPG